MTANNGEVRNSKNFLEVTDHGFENLRYGKITPTDIDGFLEYKNKAFIFFEFKYNYSEMPFGQRLALERLTDALSKTKPSVLFVTSWDDSFLDSENKINCAETIVYKIRHDNKWITPEGNPTLKDCIDWFINSIDSI